METSVLACGFVAGVGTVRLAITSPAAVNALRIGALIEISRRLTLSDGRRAVCHHTRTQAHSALRPSWVAKSSTSFAGVKAGMSTLQ